MSVKVTRLPNGVEISTGAITFDLYETEARSLFFQLRDALHDMAQGTRIAPSEPITVYVDGGCHNNGTPQARGYGSYKIGKSPQQHISWARGEADTNNEAEYRTLIVALEEIKERLVKGVSVKMDSQLVVNQVAGTWKVKEPRLRDLNLRAKTLLIETRSKLEWVNRAEIVAALGH